MDEPPPDDHVDVAQALRALAAGALLVDVRGDVSKTRDGLVEGAVIVPKTLLVSRFGRHSPERLPIEAGRTVLLFCTTERGTRPYVPIVRELGVSSVYGIMGGFRAMATSGAFSIRQPPE